MLMNPEGFRSWYDSLGTQTRSPKKLLRGCLHMKFHPGMKLVPRWNHPCVWWNVSYCLHVFAEMKFHPGMNSSLSKRHEISLRDEIEEKKMCKRFILWLNVEMSIRIYIFWLIYSNMLSKVNVLNIIRVLI